MQKINIAVSHSYKQMTRKAMASIVFFIFTYILLVILAIALTALCVALGLLVIYAKPMFLTIMLGLGLACMGLLILIFLVKFIFKKHKEDRSDLVEISQVEQPRLFSFIQEIVVETGTAFPKKIYLSDEVNAAVFYDSSFWSMFFPVRKNLIIGVGLINSTTVSEFKAILGHEFGHFSQRSMKVGSYVHNVNQVIHNMLYENTSYGSLISSVASAHAIIAVFANLAVKIVEGIQWVLRQAYRIVNLSHLGLSREMEFHADAVAAHVAGSQPLITSLQRLGFSQHSLQVVRGFYMQRSVQAAVLPANVYAQQISVMRFLADEDQLAIVDNLPAVPIDYGSRYDKSKLIIGQEWVSHPSIKDRVAALKQLNIHKGNVNNKEAFSLFEEPEAIQELFTKRIFPETSNAATVLSTKEFESAFIDEMQSNSFHKLFNGYYDNKNWVNHEDLEDHRTAALSFVDLFSDEAVDKINTELSLKYDIEVLTKVQHGEFNIRSFEYDGHKYPTEESIVVMERLRSQQTDLGREIAENDRKIHLYFKNLAKTLSKSEQFEAHLYQIRNIDKEYEHNNSIVKKLVEATDFIHKTTPIASIELNIGDLKELEVEFKVILNSLMNDPAFAPEMTLEVLEPLNHYLSKDWIYFYKDSYLEHNLKTLFTAINTYNRVLMRNYFRKKKDLLDFLATLELEHRNIPQKNIS